MKRWQWVILIFELALFALILVLPQVALPELAFHRGTAPVAAKGSFSANPVQPAAVIKFPGVIPTPLLETRAEATAITPRSAWDARLSLLCTLIC